MSQPVFISYASRDKEVADAVCRALEDNGVRCWIAPRDILPGMEYAAAIIDALNTCQVFLVIFSETSNSSPQVAREVERAISKNRTILTFRIDSTALSKAMEYYLSDRHWLDASSGKFTQFLGNLVKAVKALEAAMPSPSDNDSLLQKDRQDAKAAETKVRLDALLAKADTAIKSARWDEAIGFLNDALATKPDEAVEAKLTEVRSQQRAVRLVELKIRAQRLSDAEMLDEAIGAWKEYLRLKPDDQEEIEKMLPELHLAAKLAEDYGKSQAAIRKKHYDRAITLLKGIIAQEPAYKDSSSLLIEAEQAKKSVPSWRRYWAFEAAAALGIILLGVFFGPKLWATISPPVQQVPATAEALNPIPALPADLGSLEPVLSYVSSTPPDFVDDFSKANPAWEPFQAGITLNDGVLRLAMQAGTPTEKIGPSGRFMDANSFWLEYDFFFVGSTADATLDEGFPFTGDGVNSDIRFDLVKQDWFLGLTNSNGKSGILSEPLKGKWSHLLIIYSNNQMVGFLNGELLGHVEGISRSGGRFWIVGTTTGQAEIWLDNLKFWSLDSFNNSAASSGSPANSLSTATSTPEVLPAFVSSVQTYMAGHAPSFADDFSKANASWDPFPTGVTLKDGMLEMALEAGTPTEKVNLNSPNFSAENFWLGFDTFFDDGNGATINIIFSQAGNGSGTNYAFVIDPAKQEWFIGLTDHSNGINGNISASLMEKWSNLQMVLFDGQVAVFLNNEFLGHADGIGKNIGHIWIVATTDGQAKIRLDNVKYWDLDKIPTLP